MRSDLIRLLVDTRRKELITHADSNGGVASYSTFDRVGLSTPLSEPKRDVRPMKKVAPHSAPMGASSAGAGDAGGIDGANGAPNGK